MDEFIEKIMKTLEGHGFPSKKVSLPVEKMYEAADNRGLNFNKVLDQMKEIHQINADIQVEKIIFSKELAQQEQAGPFANPDLMKQAQEMMGKMSTEELQQMQQMFQNMSEDEKAELMRKGRELGLI
ncbi:hypothetical protein M899_0805 [Bacteriovorax sp. BSW11_IV]|uniref:hypothetical protein n=1 Tax=Bacteriovorax sp. BSW11_IV TaxID=1353529 RepID=UPI00038A1D37|nr:hypothetical protein [Bacteriovorax sp. BSW11_IV]EQC49238.1 hypothetical protein M899_0805 [Bacteriovorax sp. BSW11_IV]